MLMGRRPARRTGQDTIHAFRGQHKLRLLHELPGSLSVPPGVIKQDFVHIDDPDDLAALGDWKASEAGALGDLE